MPNAAATLYLDIDGVFSATSSRHAYPDGRRVGVDGYPLTLSRSLAWGLMSLPVEICWLMTWGSRANYVGGLVGMSACRVLTEPAQGAESSGPWKLDALMPDVVSRGRPFVWVDDDAISACARTWAEDQQPYRYLFVEPQPNRGLSTDEVQSIGEWLSER